MPSRPTEDPSQIADNSGAALGNAPRAATHAPWRKCVIWSIVRAYRKSGPLFSMTSSSMRSSAMVRGESIGDANERADDECVQLQCKENEFERILKPKRVGIGTRLRRRCAPKLTSLSPDVRSVRVCVLCDLVCCKPHRKWISFAFRWTRKVRNKNVPALIDLMRCDLYIHFSC